MQRPDGAVEITTPAEAAGALSTFRSYSKLLSWLVVHAAGLPAPRGIVVSAWTDAVADAVAHFTSQWETRSLLVRSDAEHETAESPRGGFLSRHRDVEEQVGPLLKDGRVVFLLEPLSPLDDLYSLSLQPDATWRHWVAEIVGPGFDASDLKRGDVTPHEQLTLRLSKGELEVESQRLSSAEAQGTARALRLEKIAALLGCSTASVAEVLRERRETLFIDRTAYAPIPQDLLRTAVTYAAHLNGALRRYELAAVEDVLVSMSFISTEARPVFWDIVWPSSKYVGTTARYPGRCEHG